MKVDLIIKNVELKEVHKSYEIRIPLNECYILDEEKEEEVF